MTERVALITGGAKGIGRAIARDLAQQGWIVAFCYRQSQAEARSLELELRAGGATAFGEVCDVSDFEQCRTLVDRVAARCGRIDALVHCAGPYHRVALLDETIAGWHEMFDHNLHPVFYLSRMVAPGMVARCWGRIVTFSMANADQMAGQPHVTGHYIAKAGVLILTRTLAKILGPNGITVNAISPGFIDSGSAPAEELQRAVKSIPAGYIGSVDDVVGVARFLLSDAARYVNGANVQISGAWGV